MTRYIKQNKTRVMPQQDIERLAREYAKELYPEEYELAQEDENSPNYNSEAVDVIENCMADLICHLRFILRDHCIVPKEKVREKYSVCKMGYNECEAVDLGYAMGILEELFGTELFCGKEGGMSDAKDCKHIIPMNFKCIHIKTKMRYGKYIGCPRIFNTDIDCPDRCGRTACSRIRPTY